ncbi:BspA family leucine-rich repeat surface protein [Allomuricauda sp. NBRC 101325]|uniref:BspA family leucine-rich repeat surface protein n=1 Tax=Allomuricauda sp. NBRC 101325 TaxID=1113758 RepID=UPI0024A4BEAB|nr:BspA family leucine-rich repeat surface protein [Muricauda sp. NBRC 101325]GLU44492.1 hypothetical protein Musp01_21160 [Muricauda sp. NBRC 101325]
MNRNLYFFGFLALIMFWSCSEDDTSDGLNQRPVIYEQTFNPPEAISVTDEIGPVKAYDSNLGTKLSYSIANNSNDMFEIANVGGSLTLKEGKTLDFTSVASHKITVAVSDGEYESLAEITINVNIAPEFDEEAYVFEVIEDIDPDFLIGTLSATDVHGDMLTFSIAQNDNELFEISEFGELSLADEKSLNFEAENGQEHTIVVSITDGVYTVEKEVKIVVLDVEERLADDPASFVTKWNITGNGDAITIYTHIGLSYDYTIDWGDGTVEELTDQDPSHVYDVPGIYTVAIQGDFPAIQMDNKLLDMVSMEALVSIEQWGHIEWQSMEKAFYGCSNLAYNAVDVPNLTKVTVMPYMFAGCTLFDGDLSNWNTENVSNMAYMFWNASSFNGDIKDWKVENVLYFSEMFRNAKSFNGNISNWDTQSAESFYNMFEGATVFDQDLGNWKLDNIVAFGDMFSNSGMSPENYSNTLNGWYDQMETVQLIGASLGAVGINYTCDAKTAHDLLISDHQWVIDDEGLENPCQ